MVDDHHRAHERHDLPGLAPGEVKIYQPIEIRQLSAGGALIELAVPLQIDSLHDFRLSLGERSVVLKARVVHSHINTVGSDRVAYHTGIEFADVSGPVAVALASFIEALQRAERP